MAKLIPVRNTSKRVSRRSSRLDGKKPIPTEYPGSDYLFTITVSGYPVPVFLTKIFQEPEATGEYVQVLDEIYITADPNLSKQRLGDTMLHESLHAMSYIGLSPKDRLSERQVNSLATIFMETLRRSPEFKELLLDSL